MLHAALKTVHGEDALNKGKHIYTALCTPTEFYFPVYGQIHSYKDDKNILSKAKQRYTIAQYVAKHDKG